MGKPPTPQAISVLLRKAGFERSGSRATRIKGYRRSTDGYSVTGRLGTCEVGHFGRDGTEAQRVQVLAAYRVYVRDAGGFAPRLIVTARKAGSDD